MTAIKMCELQAAVAQLDVGNGTQRVGKTKRVVPATFALDLSMLLCQLLMAANHYRLVLQQGLGQAMLVHNYATCVHVLVLTASTWSK